MTNSSWIRFFGFPPGPCHDYVPILWSFKLNNAKWTPRPYPGFITIFSRIFGMMTNSSWIRFFGFPPGPCHDYVPTLWSFKLNNAKWTPRPYPGFITIFSRIFGMMTNSSWIRFFGFPPGPCHDHVPILWSFKLNNAKWTPRPYPGLITIFSRIFDMMTVHFNSGGISVEPPRRPFWAFKRASSRAHLGPALACACVRGGGNPGAVSAGPERCPPPPKSVSAGRAWAMFALRSCRPCGQADLLWVSTATGNQSIDESIDTPFDKWINASIHTYV